MCPDSGYNSQFTHGTCLMLHARRSSSQHHRHDQRFSLFAGHRYEPAADPHNDSLIHQIIRKRTVVTRRSGIDRGWCPIPGQEFVDAVHGMTVRHALEDIPEVSIGFDVVELCRGYQRTDRCPSFSAAIGAGEQMVFAPERHGPDSALDRIVVELDAAVVEEPAQRRPARERIADGLGQPAAWRNPAQLALQPGLSRL